MEGSFTCSEGTTGAGTGQIDTLSAKQKERQTLPLLFEYYWIKVDLGNYLGKAFTEGSLT